MLYTGNYDTALATTTDPTDLYKKWLFSIRLWDERGGKHIVYPAIFSSFTYRKGERVQVVNGFDEVTHIYAFGKNPGQFQLGGHVISDGVFNQSFLKTGIALTAHYNEILRAFEAANAGVRTEIYGPNIENRGGIIMKGVAVDFAVSMDAAVNSIMNFSLNFIEVDRIMGLGVKNPTREPLTKVGQLNIISQDLPILGFFG